MTTDEQGKSPKCTIQLTEDFRLPNLRSDPDAPPIDSELLSAFAELKELTGPEVKRVLTNLDRYEEWRDALARMIAEQWKKHQHTEIKTDFPPPASS